MRPPSRPTALVLAAATALALASVAEARPIKYEGKTQQGREAGVVVKRNGSIAATFIRWKAPCDTPGRYALARTVFVPPFDRASTTSFRDAGEYTLTDNGLRGSYNVGMKGTKVSARKWKGTFRGSVVLRHRRTGKRFGRCSIGPIRWSARRR